MINVTINGDTELIAKIGGYSNRLHDELLPAMKTIGLELQTKVQDEKLSGQVLKVETGALRRSIHESTDDQGQLITTQVFSSGDVKYAAIHEFGGTTGPHEILPVKGKVLAFPMGGEMVFTTKVNHPGSKMPERSFMRSSLKEMQSEIVAEIGAAAQRATEL